ncbi:NnrS family protein [Salinisphaera sp.]|uniref:NnrS family protein n=1 Tax=Salinisphaera sp. TaxID=1914330 RepID=UPI002D775D54|nr:NnrS family protein [Salinisphaera sp.]HET7314283.1 NnrS family protein [Salinisphaera sp.]
MAGRAAIVLASPHRPFFLAGAAQIVAAMGLWLTILCGWYLPGTAGPTLAVPGMAVHVFLMLYGLFPFFVFGFALTAFPRWLNSAPVPKARYARIAAGMALGVCVAYIGFLIDRRLAAAGAALFVAAWGFGWVTLYRVWRHSPRVDKRFALFPLGCIAAGWLGAAIYVAGLIVPRAPLLEPAIAIGIWLFLVPLIVAISHRMIPFFSSRVLSDYRIAKPGWTLPATLLCVAAHCSLAIAGRLDWSLFCDLPLAALAAWHSWRWGLARSLRNPLLGMLHVAFAWLAVAMTLYAIDSLLQFFGARMSLGTAPLHALGIGFVTGMVVAMATRVSLGHSGRPLIAGRVALWAFTLIQVTAVVRVLAECPVPSGLRPWLILAAAALWLVALLPWTLRYGAAYLGPRVDGAPG